MILSFYAFLVSFLKNGDVFYICIGVKNIYIIYQQLKRFVYNIYCILM